MFLNVPLCSFTFLYVPQRSFSFLNVPFGSSTLFLFLIVPQRSFMFLNVPLCSLTFLVVPQEWNKWSLEYLVQARCQPNPPTFKNIAFFLNHNEDQSPQDRPFTVRDCINKWQSFFPMSTDVNRAMEHLRKLQARFVFPSTERDWG